MLYSNSLKSVSAIALVHILSGSPVWAQVDENTAVVEVSDVDEDSVKTYEAVKVTGSWIPRTGFETPSPITVVSAEDLSKSSPSTLAAALNNLPALVAEGGPNATSGQRTAGRNYLNLRGIGANRTLTLVNGRRFPGSSPGGTVDTNLIPQGLVERVEVVTGGASAAYGSDAVAGVVNFILDTDFQGAKLSGSVGMAEEGDGFEHRISGTYGRELGDGLNFVISAEYYDAEGIDGDARDHRVQGANLIPNPNADGTAANPDLIIADQARLSTSTAGGLVNPPRRGSPHSYVGLQFLPDGSLAPFDAGTNTTADFQDGGDGINTAIFQPITRPLRRATIYSGLTYDFSSNLTGFINGSLGYSKSSNAATAFHTGRYAISVTSDNPFLAASTVANWPTSRGSDVTLSVERYDTEYDMIVEAENVNKRIEAGFDWTYGDFHLVASGQFGSNVEEAPNFNNYIPDLYAQGVDSILDNGQIVCRDPSNGCVPINPFGVGSYTQEMIDFFTGTSQLETHVEQTIFQTRLNGPIFDGIGAGEWMFAVGAESRTLEAEVIVDELSQNADYFTNNFQGWSADRNVTEVFGEIHAPIFLDKPGAKLLDVNIAARQTDYEYSGQVETWKVGINYKPIDDLRFRGSVSRDIRAPSLSEMFTAGRETTRTIINRDTGLSNRSTRYRSTGNPFLVPEVADTLILGAVYTPSWAPGLSISLDRYDIEMEDALRTLSGQTLIDSCQIDGVAQACLQFDVDTSTGLITEVRNSNFNLDSLTLKGWDFEGRYEASFGPGELTLRTQIGYMEEQVEADSGGNPIDRVGETITPEWRALASANYDYGNWNFFLQGRYRGESQLNVNWGPGDSEFNDVSAVTYLDGQIGYSLDDNTSFYVNVQNLLDKDPEFAPLQDTYFSPTDPNVFDQIGRAYRIGFRKTF